MTHTFDLRFLYIIGCSGPWCGVAARRRHLARVQEVRGAEGAGWGRAKRGHQKQGRHHHETGMTGNIFTRNFLLT